MTNNIIRYISAGYPALAIATTDEDRTVHSILSQCKSFEKKWKIAATGGLIDASSGKRIEGAAPGVSMPGMPQQAAPQGAVAYADAFERTSKSREPVVTIVLDFQHSIRNATSYRALRNSLLDLKQNGSVIIFLAPSWSLPPELEHDIPVIHESLPSREELSAALRVCVDGVQASRTRNKQAALTISSSTVKSILDAASGLTLAEAEGAMALAYNGKEFDASTVLDEKMATIKSCGYLEVSKPASLSEVGGLGELRRYIQEEVVPTIDDPLLRVRGMIFAGVPGGGKSLMSRVLGSILGRAVVRADIAATKGSKVGETEANTKQMLKLVEAVAPCVLYFDEIEKANAGHAQSNDGGVSAAQNGILLTWLQDHTADVITVATCNNYLRLPAELTRAGRFDERFFVDLPILNERIDIAAVHLRSFGCKDELVASAADMIAGHTDGWTGAEIEQLVKSSARRTRRNITEASLIECKADIKPISQVRAQEISELRAWGKANLRLANSLAPETVVTMPSRKIGARGK